MTGVRTGAVSDSRSDRAIRTSGDMRHEISAVTTRDGSAGSAFHRDGHLDKWLLTGGIDYSACDAANLRAQRRRSEQHGGDGWNEATCHCHTSVLREEG